MIKDSTDREQTAHILTGLGYEVGRDWKFSLREDERTPSTSIRKDGLITDFGDDWSGDIVALLYEKRGLSLKDATLYVCEQMGVSTDESYEYVPLPLKRTPQPQIELTQERYSEIMVELWQFDQSQEMQTFKNQDYRDEALSIVPMWLWQQTSKENIALFKKLTTFDAMNKTLIVKIHDYTGKVLSYKRRRYRQSKWVTAHSTHPNSQCIVSITDSSSPVYVVEGHHDLLTAILTGINVLMIPTVGYKTFNNRELSILKDKTVVFLPDLKRGDSKGMDTMNILSEQVIDSVKSVNVVSVKKILDLMEIPFTSDSIDLSDVVEVWGRDLDSFKNTLLYVGEGVMLEGEVF